MKALSSLTGPGLVMNIISVIVAIVIVAALFPTLDNAVSDLQQAAQNSSNSLITAISPALPYILGLILLGIIFWAVRSAIQRFT